jgi:hypothetical protein
MLLNEQKKQGSRLECKELHGDLIGLNAILIVELAFGV